MDGYGGIQLFLGYPRFESCSEPLHDFGRIVAYHVKSENPVCGAVNDEFHQCPQGVLFGDRSVEKRAEIRSVYCDVVSMSLSRNGFGHAHAGHRGQRGAGEIR